MQYTNFLLKSINQYNLTPPYNSTIVPPLIPDSSCLGISEIRLAKPTTLPPGRQEERKMDSKRKVKKKKKQREKKGWGGGLRLTADKDQGEYNI